MELKNISLLNLMKTFDIGGTEKWAIQLSNLLADRLNKIVIMATEGFYSERNIISHEVKKYFIPFKMNHNPFSFWFNLTAIIKGNKK